MEVDGQARQTESAFAPIIDRHQPGQVALTLLRGTQTLQITLVLGQAATS
jgi:hypothetical protein